MGVDGMGSPKRKTTPDERQDGQMRGGSGRALVTARRATTGSDGGSLRIDSCVYKQFAMFSALLRLRMFAVRTVE
jgi:hypothetical protein